MIDFDLIKGRIQQYKLSSLVHNILETLNKMQKDKDRMYPFWNLLTLLKWSYLHTRDSNIRKNVTPQDLDYLLKLIEKFEGSYTLSFKDAASVRKSFLIIAYQQFPYQDTFFNSVVDRQLVLYLQLKSSFDIEEDFKKRTGIDILSFFNYCYFTFLYFSFDETNNGYEYNGILHQDYIDFFIKKFPGNEINKFVSLLTINKPEDFESLHKLKKEIFQLYETNFFITKPFIRFRNQIRIPHRAIFVQTISHFVYAFLKTNSPLFPEEFGKRLEKYIELGLKEIKANYINENELKKRYALQKVTDFLIDNDILIESKATELQPRSGVLRLPDIITKDLDDTIVKAYLQLLSTANIIDKNKQWYGIIITYREMYLGFGDDAWKEFLKQPIEKLLEETVININILPPENIFFMTIDNWDHCIQALKEGVASSLKEILLKGKELNKSENPQERVLMMEQVLRKHFAVDRLTHSYLQEAHKLVDVLP